MNSNIYIFNVLNGSCIIGRIKSQGASEWTLEKAVRLIFDRDPNNPQNVSMGIAPIHPLLAKHEAKNIPDIALVKASVESYFLLPDDSSALTMYQKATSSIITTNAGISMRA